MEKPLLNHFPFTPKHPVVKNVTARFGEEPFFSDHPPDAGTICGVFNAAFWASTQSEEGRSVRVSLALMNPDYSRSPEIFRFSDPVGLSSQSITKLSASFPFRGGAIAVTFPPGGDPYIWGFVLPKPKFGWLIEILGPGYVVVRDDLDIEAALLPSGSPIVFEELTRLEDGWYEFLNSNAAHTSLVRQIPFGKFYECLRVLAQSMVDHRRGGSVVLVSPHDEGWKDSIDFTYRFDRPEEYLFSLAVELKKWVDNWDRQQEEKRRAKGGEGVLYVPESEEERKLHRALRLVGGLTAVDGAMVMTTDLKILGYGAKLKAHTEHLTVREWLPSGGYAERPMQNIGGTRHSSAAQFVSRYPGTVIFVASQDGRFTIFCCNEDGTEVLAHRVELLLL